MQSTCVVGHILAHYIQNFVHHLIVIVLLLLHTPANKEICDNLKIHNIDLIVLLIELIDEINLILGYFVKVLILHKPIRIISY